MPLRFHKSFKILPGVKLNLSKGGISTSIGGRGHSLNFGKRGVRSTVGLPGTGVSYTTGTNKTNQSSNVKGKGCFYYFFIWPFVLIFQLYTLLFKGLAWLWKTATATPQSRKISLISIGVIAVLILCYGAAASALTMLGAGNTPVPTLDINSIGTGAALTAWSPFTQTAAAIPTSTCTLTTTPTKQILDTPTLIEFPISTHTNTPAATPTLFTYPTQSPSGSGGGSTGACCKHCGSTSQACGNSCISLSKTCHQPPGCACN